MNSFDSHEEKPVMCEVPRKRGRTLSCNKTEIKKRSFTQEEERLVKLDVIIHHRIIVQQFHK